MDDGFSSRLTRLGRRLLHPARAAQVVRQATGLLTPPPAMSTPLKMPLQMPLQMPLPMPAGLGRGTAGGATEEVSGFGANPGGLRMLMHVSPVPPRPGAPLLVLLHGCGQDAANFAAASGFVAVADRLGAALLLPEQQAANNQGRCFNWFAPADIRRDGGEAASIRAMVAAAVRRHGSDPRRVFVAGLSAGGAMAAAMLAAYPDVFAGGAVVAGLPVGVATDISSALALMSHAGADSRAALAARLAAAPDGARWPLLSVWHGTGDRTVDPANADALVAQWTGRLALPDAPDAESQPAPGVRRRAWGRAVEQWSIAGMGHGLPIAGRVSADPYVLPAPVQAADAIARFWGLQLE
jgi:poly(hydroxyalkanoate) depolymerase family esterase